MHLQEALFTIRHIFGLDKLETLPCTFARQN